MYEGKFKHSYLEEESDTDDSDYCGSAEDSCAEDDDTECEDSCTEDESAEDANMGDEAEEMDIHW